MSGPGLSCVVQVEGAPLADSAADYLGDAPTVLSGLSLTWGRTDITDQPDTAACTFTVVDRGADRDPFAVLHVGRRVDVYAAGVVAGADPDGQDVAEDGDFEASTPAARISATNATASASSSAATGTVAYLLTGTGAAGAEPVLWVPIAPYGTTPEDWNHLPALLDGQDWSVALSVQLGPGMTAALQPATWTSPTAAAGTPAGAAVPVPNAGAAYRQVIAPWTVAGIGDRVAWLGARLTATRATWASAGAGTWADQPGTWAGWGSLLIDTFQVIAPPGASRSVLVFSGRITDLAASPDPAGVAVKVICSDLTTDLANYVLANAAWSSESMGARVSRIRGLSEARFAYTIDPSLGPTMLTYLDFDTAQVMDLLTQLATSTDAVLWSAFSLQRGFYLWYEDPGTRANYGVLAFDPVRGLVEITTTSARPADAALISACDLLAEPTSFEQDSAEVITRVAVGWLEQIPATPTEPLAHTLIDVDTHAEAPPAQGGLGYGVRNVSVSTQLTTSNDAVGVASRILNRSRALGWRADALVWDTALAPPAPDWSNADRAAALDLLDGLARLARPLVITDLPAWSPAGPSLPTYLEGGRYSYEDGAWRLELTISPSGMTGYSVQWNDLDPAWRWKDFDRKIRWLDLWGVTAATGAPRWYQVTGAWSAQTKTWQQFRGPQLLEA